MQLIQNLQSLSIITNVHIRHLLEQRFLGIADGEGFDADIHGYALIVEPGDKLEDLLANPDSLIIEGLLEITPYAIPPESVEEHHALFDVVFIPGDGDYGITVIIPKLTDVDPELLSVCAELATTAHPEESA